jgi:TetR/AcrR family transcriptional repressor of nem operon
MGDLSQPLREKLSLAIDAMARRVALVLAEAQASGELAPGADPQALGYFIISSWQGALIRMKVCKCAEPLETFEQVVFGRLLAA